MRRMSRKNPVPLRVASDAQALRIYKKLQQAALRVKEYSREEHDILAKLDRVERDLIRRGLIKENPRLRKLQNPRATVLHMGAKNATQFKKKLQSFYGLRKKRNPDTYKIVTAKVGPLGKSSQVYTKKVKQGIPCKQCHGGEYWECGRCLGSGWEPVRDEPYPNPRRGKRNPAFPLGTIVKMRKPGVDGAPWGTGKVIGRAGGTRGSTLYYSIEWKHPTWGVSHEPHYRVKRA